MEQSHHKHSTHSHHHIPDVIRDEIETSISYREGTVKIQLLDDEGNSPQLELTHEKMMHLIIVSDDLSEFHHLHPLKVNANDYTANILLSGSAYTAFVDIKPLGKGYLIKPLQIKMNSDIPQKKTSLEKDKTFKKEVNGKTVELIITKPLITDEPITLNFNVDESPSPYLGALGHVVIVDQEVQQFLHVHPISDHETTFQTQFKKPGLYKLWAEFKFGEIVTVFPYVIEVRSEYDNKDL
ncbi:hypothetical protein ACVBAX_24580 [Robertmurraya sp. GLU-23]